MLNGKNQILASICTPESWVRLSNTTFLTTVYFVNPATQSSNSSFVPPFTAFFFCTHSFADEIVGTQRKPAPRIKEGSVPKWFFLKIPSIQPKNHENHGRKSPKSRKNHEVFSLDSLIIDPPDLFYCIFMWQFFLKNTEMSLYFFLQNYCHKFFLWSYWTAWPGKFMVIFFGKVHFLG